MLSNPLLTLSSMQLITHCKISCISHTSSCSSIICIGVGDGPWDRMREFDDGLPARRFDNFQFVPFNEVMERAENREVSFAVAAMQEVPEQYQAVKKLGLLNR